MLGRLHSAARLKKAFSLLQFSSCSEPRFSQVYCSIRSASARVPVFRNGTTRFLSSLAESDAPEPRPPGTIRNAAIIAHVDVSISQIDPVSRMDTSPI